MLIVAVGGYVGATKWHDSRLAAEDRRVLAETKAYTARANAIMVRLPHLSGFTPTTGSPSEPCNIGDGATSCYDVARHPEPALDAWLTALHSVDDVKVENRGCELPVASDQARRTFGATPPCHARGTVDGVDFSLIAFPQIDHTRTKATHHVVLSGSSRVSFTLVKPF